MVETIRGIVAMSFLLINTVIWCLPIFALGVVRPLTPSRYRPVLGTVMFQALDAWVGCVRWLVRVLGIIRIDSHVDTDAAPFDRQGWFVIVSNHQTWADILVLVVWFYGRLPPFKFFTKQQLVWVPFLGQALWLLEYPFVRRYGRAKIKADPALAERDRQATHKACRSFRERPTSVLIFLEGTRFSAEKRDGQSSPYRFLLRPKTRGLGIVLEELDGMVDAMIDVTIDYSGPAPGFWPFLCGRCRSVAIDVQTMPTPIPGERLQPGMRDTRPSQEETLRTWAETLWAEKDRRLGEQPTTPG